MNDLQYVQFCDAILDGLRWRYEHALRREELSSHVDDPPAPPQSMTNVQSVMIALYPILLRFDVGNIQRKSIHYSG